MCCKVKIKSVCATCNGHIGENNNTRWCRDARRRGTLGRCSSGLRRAEEEFRGEECQKCYTAREDFMEQLEMNELAQKGLGWRTRGSGGGRTSKETFGNGNGGGESDEDSGSPYTW